MTQGSRGAAFERVVMAALRGHGWLVIRAAGSRGPFDLLALSADGREPAMIQAKLGGPGRLAPLEWNALLALAAVFGAVPLVAHRPRRGTVQFDRLIGPKPERGVRGPAAPCEEWAP